MKSMILTTLLLLSSLAFAQSEPIEVAQATSLDYEGTWFYQQESDGMKIKAYFTFAPNYVALKNECSWGGLFGVHLTAEVAANIIVGPNGQPYAPQQHVEKAVRHGSSTYRCAANIDANTTPKKGSYKVIGNLMYFYDAQGQPVRDSAGNDIVMRKVR